MDFYKFISARLEASTSFKISSMPRPILMMKTILFDGDQDYSSFQHRELSLGETFIIQGFLDQRHQLQIAGPFCYKLICGYE